MTKIYRQRSRGRDGFFLEYSTTSKERSEERVKNFKASKKIGTFNQVVKAETAAVSARKIRGPRLIEKDFGFCKK